MNTRTRATGATALIALGSLAVTLLLLASPAGAATSQESGGSVAVNGSVSSGTCLAVDNSTCSGSGAAVGDSVSSGDAVAVNGSTASGCSFAADVSTASGGACAAPVPPTPPTPDRPGRPAARAATTKAGVATPTATTGLAFTGSATGPLTAAAVVALALGLLLVTLGSDRRRPVHSSVSS